MRIGHGGFTLMPMPTCLLVQSVTKGKLVMLTLKRLLSLVNLALLCTLAPIA